ncbi:hypothetical protein HYH03_003109 [Edaphochlamys debaryana]|uniref:Fungal lipase-type domain-containing protein n=1 Tax=Edaphochlamys debaryana TaxID=47281 RepID=A0A835YJP9_9CHLO|nr:hypothetical protein HYH03_003109 [Edaphochlamys debaryana]|eukprot:KAG2498919.1 hypothetical protein HYH03_003109 [Edaphochlamys debaryana]
MLLMHYGQLTQATYDNLGLDPCNATWGYTTVAPGKMIDYLTQNYPLAPGVQITPSTPKGTNELYFVPKADDLSPLIYAQAGAGVSEDLPPAPAGTDGKGALPGVNTLPGSELFDRIFSAAASLPTALIGGSRPLFKQNPKTGRGLVSRSAFMGYVAVSQPSGPDSERDAVFVWRGTIFKEEWAANFGQDKLVPFDPKFDQDGECPTADPHKPGVHDGFHDLYMRNARQPDPSNPGAVPALPKKGTKEVAPRTVVTQWLKKLQQEYNITTVTTTGHSLGGALSTLSAYDIGLQLKDMWADPKLESERKGWKTKAMPKVSAIAFAPPRVGNFKFLEDFSDNLHVKELRICNVKDAVPKIPGGWVQVLTSVLYKLGVNVFDDMDSPAERAFGSFYNWVCCVCSDTFNWRSRWGYFHVGQILEVDSDKNFVDHNGKPLGATDNIGKHHNLEVYLHFLDKKGVDAKGQPLTTNRNPLLLNKGDDILVDKEYPADWWRAHVDRGYQQLADGRWQFPAKPV